MDIADCWRSGGFAVGKLGGGPTGIIFARNTVTRTGSSSIFVGGNNSTVMIGANETEPRMTDVLIEGNDCSFSNVSTDWNTNGADSEAITVGAGVHRFKIRGNWVHHTEQYGIDAKAGAKDFEITGNIIEDVELFAIYLDSARRYVEDGIVRGNIIRRCKNGIVLAREAATANGPGFAAEYAADPAEFDGMSMARIIIDSNSIFETEQSGIFFQRHPRDGPAGRILDIQAGFNTVVNANREGAGNPSATTFDLNLSGWFDADMRAANVAQNVNFFCNIVSNNTDAVRIQNTFTGQPGYTEARNFIGDAQFANLNSAPPNLRLVAGEAAASLSIASDLVGFETDIEGLTRAVGPIGAYSEIVTDLVITVEDDGKASLSWTGTLTGITAGGGTVHDGTYNQFHDGNALAFTRLPNFAGRALHVVDTAEDGDTLTAGEILIMYADGQAEPTVTIQWWRNGADTGARGQTFDKSAEEGVIIRPVYVITAAGPTTVTELGSAVVIPGVPAPSGLPVHTLNAPNVSTDTTVYAQDIGAIGYAAGDTMVIVGGADRAPISVTVNGNPATPIHTLTSGGGGNRASLLSYLVAAGDVTDSINISVTLSNADNDSGVVFLNAGARTVGDSDFAQEGDGGAATTTVVPTEAGLEVLTVTIGIAANFNETVGTPPITYANGTEFSSFQGLGHDGKFGFSAATHIDATGASLTETITGGGAGSSRFATFTMVLEN